MEAETTGHRAPRVTSGPANVFEMHEAMHRGARDEECMTSARLEALSSPYGGALQRRVDTFWVLASWFSAYGLYGLLASPAELLTFPQLLPYGLVGIPVAMASAALSSALGLYRAASPLIGLRVAASVVLVRLVELAVLGALLVLALEAALRDTALLMTHSLLACTAVLGWRGFLRVLAPYGFDFSRLTRRSVIVPEVQVAVRDSGVRARPGDQPRTLPRAKSR